MTDTYSADAVSAELKRRKEQSPIVDELKRRKGDLQTGISQVTSAYDRDVMGHEPDIDYKGSAPFALRVATERSSNPKEVELELKKYYPEGDYGQDKRGRWWVKEGGKKVSLEPTGGLGAAASRFGTGLAATSTPIAGSILGGSLGALGGPAAPFTVPLGIGLGAAGGRGLDEAIKYFRGTYNKKPSELTGELGNEAALNMALGGAGRLFEGIGPWIKKNIFGVTPQTASTAERLLEGGATPPIGSVAPEATGFERKRQLRDIVSKGGAPPKQNVEYTDQQMKRLLRESGVPDLEKAAEEVTSRTSAIDRTQAGESIVEAAKRKVDSHTAIIDDSLNQAKTSLDIQEKALRTVSKQDVGRLSQDVANTITGARKAFGAQMSKAYKEIHNMTGDRPVIDLTEAINEARQISELMQGQTPKLIKDLTTRNNNMATIEEAHALRSTMRNLGEMNVIPNLTPDQNYALFSRVEDGVDNAFKKLAREPAGMPAEAARKLAQTDKQYGEGIAKFRDATLNKLVRDTRSGLVPNPEVVAQAIMREGNTERTRQILSMVSPELKQNIMIADLRNVLSKSSHTGEKGNIELNGKALLSELNEREASMGLLYDKTGLRYLKSFAKQLAAVDGDIPVSSLSDPTKVTQQLRRWAMEKDQLDRFAKENPLGLLRTKDPRAIDASLRRITAPGNTPVTESMMRAMKPEERKQVHQFFLKQLFSDAMRESPSKVRTVSGDAIESTLSKYPEKQLDLLLPYGMTGDLKELAKDLKFLFPKDTDLAGSLAAASVTSKGFFNPFGLRKRIEWFLSGWLTDRPQVLHWFANLHRTEPGAARQAMTVLGRWAANSAVSGVPSGSPQTK